MKRILAASIVMSMMVALFPVIGTSAAFIVSGDFEHVVYENEPYRGAYINKYTGTAEHYCNTYVWLAQQRKHLPRIRGRTSYRS